MVRTRPVSGLRAAALAAALFAITLNFLQPLAHAALMRDGAPSTLWSVFCNFAPDSETRKDGLPVTVDKHECCLGLAHAVAVAAPPTAFTTLPRVAVAVRPLPAVALHSPVGIRDGPTRPRGPPSLA